LAEEVIVGERKQHDEEHHNLHFTKHYDAHILKDDIYREFTVDRSGEQH
jgi:hypothetical protein